MGGGREVGGVGAVERGGGRPGRSWGLRVRAGEMGVG